MISVSARARRGRRRTLGGLTGLLILLGATAAALPEAGCASRRAAAPVPTPAPQPVSPADKLAAAGFKVEKIDLVPDPSEVRRTADASNGFGFDLLRRLSSASSGGGNVFLSPSSVFTSLALAQSGATEGLVQGAMAKVLGLSGQNRDAIDRAANDLREALISEDPRVLVLMTNALFVDKGIKVSEEFVRSAQSRYRADIGMVDFKQPAAADAINTRIKEATRGNIPQLVSASDLAPPTAAVLTNTLYFKGLWAQPFKKEDTDPGTFTLADGSTKQVPLMVADSRETDVLRGVKGFEGAVRLPYGNARYALYAFLPEEGKNPADFARQLNASSWRKWRDRFKKESISFKFPRFKAEFATELSPALAQQGMGAAFKEGSFTPMGIPNSALQKVKHKVVLEVDEQGTTAAAATGVVLETLSASLDDLTFDRPFFVAIGDEDTGSVLFAGIVNDPTQ